MGDRGDSARIVRVAITGRRSESVRYIIERRCIF